MGIRNNYKRMICTTSLVFVMTIIVFGSLVESGVYAEPTLTISVHRDFGYSSGGDINGKFTITVHGSDDVVFVEFYLDNELQLNSTAIPYKWSFDTADYSLGDHTIQVVAFNSQGESATESMQANFVPSVINLMVGVIIVIIVVILILLVIAMKHFRLGLTKCPKCGHVFPRRRSVIQLALIYRNKCPKCDTSFWAKNVKGLEMAEPVYSEPELVSGAEMVTEEYLTDEEENDEHN